MVFTAAGWVYPLPPQNPTKQAKNQTNKNCGSETFEGEFVDEGAFSPSVAMPILRGRLPGNARKQLRGGVGVQMRERRIPSTCTMFRRDLGVKPADMTTPFSSCVYAHACMCSLCKKEHEQSHSRMKQDDFPSLSKV